MEKNELIGLVTKAREDIRRAFDAASEDELATRPVVDEWTAKDVLGHYSLWSGVSLGWARSLHAGEPLKPVFPEAAAVDSFNAEQFARRRYWPLARLRSEYEETLAALLAQVQGATQEQLDRPLGAPWADDFTLSRAIWRTSFDHPQEHLPAIREALGQG